MNLYEASEVRQMQKSSFYNKVFSLFGLALGVSGLGVYVGFAYLLPYFAQNPMLMFGVFAVELILIFTSGMWSKREPLNYLLFAAFTFLSGLTLVPLLGVFLAEFKSFDIIYRSLFSATAVFVAMGLIGRSINKPLNGLAGFLLMALIGMLVVGIIGIFIPWGNTGEMIYSGIGVAVFALYAMVDINRLKHYPEDEYIHAAMQLYLDFFNLFVFVLRLTGALSRD